jgi:multidrug efflux system membrane fusion protein
MSDSTAASHPSPPAPAKAIGVPRPPDAAATGGWRKVAGPILSVLAVAGAVVLTLVVWGVVEEHPRTDDAILRANVVGIAPRVHGQIIRLNVVDNQEVREGDVLFEIDPEDYRLTLERARSALASLDQQIEVAHAQDTELKFKIKAAAAGVASARAQFKQADDTLGRTLPLLARGFTTAEDVDKARTARAVAESNVAAQEQALSQAQTTLSTLASLSAQRPGAVAAVDTAALELSYCKVVAPFPGKVISLNLSPGAYASVGAPVFSLLDTRHWYVIANFREGEIRHLSPGAPVDVYLLADPARRFTGHVQGTGWAVESPDSGIELPGHVPSIRRELNWVHIAQRFPVRIEIEHPDPALFRMGASAVAISR